MDIGPLFSPLLHRLEQSGARSITDLQLGPMLEAATVIAGHETERLTTLGVHVEGNKDILFAALRPDQRFGTVHVTNGASGSVVFLGEHNQYAASQIGLRLVAPNAIVAMPDMTQGGSAFFLPNVLLRSPSQMMFWGANASAVMAQLELEGEGRALLVGDDAMLSNDVWLRNHDMHAIYDTKTGQINNLHRGDLVLEQHVWLGQGALVLGGRRIGFGSIIAARTLLLADVAPETLVGGSPGRVIRSDIAWGRPPQSIEPETFARLERLRKLQPPPPT